MGSDRSVVQSLDRALSILDVLRLSDAGLSLGDLAARVGLPKSTTHRLLSTLERRGFVARDSTAGTYHLGGKAVAPVGAGPEVRAILEEVAGRCGETANLGALIGREVLYVDRADSPHALRWQLGVGSRVPAHCSAMGKAILAFLSPRELARGVPRRLKPYTANTITNRQALLEELELVRRRGYAMDNEEFMDGVRCVAVPVESRGDDAGNSISLAGPAFRLTRRKAESYVASLRHAADRIRDVLLPGALPELGA